MSAAARERLAQIPGLGPILAARLVRRGLTTKEQLRTIIDELPQETQLHLRYNISRNIPYRTAKSVTDELKRRLVFTSPAGRRRKYPTVTVGSVRRTAPQSKDLDLLVVVPDKTHLANVLASARLADNVSDNSSAAGALELKESYASGARRRSFVARYKNKYYAIDLFLATQEEKPYALLHYTGGKEYNIRVRAHAKRNGYVLNQYGVFCASTSARTSARTKVKRRAPGSKDIRTERELLEFLGVTYKTPRSRV